MTIRFISPGIMFFPLFKKNGLNPLTNGLKPSFKEYMQTITAPYNSAIIILFKINT